MNVLGSILQFLTLWCKMCSETLNISRNAAALPGDLILKLPLGGVMLTFTFIYLFIYLFFCLKLLAIIYFWTALDKDNIFQGPQKVFVK